MTCRRRSSIWRALLAAGEPMVNKYWPGLFVALLAVCGGAWAAPPDPLFIGARAAPSPIRALGDELPAEDPCAFAAPSSPLPLTEAIERALCQNPQTRAAWEEARSQAALLGVARAAWLPSMAASVGYLAQDARSRYEGEYEVLDAQTRPKTRSGSLKLSWTLFDAGLRSANTEQAGALLDAANASHDLSIQRALLETAQAYFDAQTAVALLRAAQAAETSASHSYRATEAKYEAGVGALADKLQAAVALSDARLQRVTAEGDLQTALGTLATALGLAPDTPLTLPARDLALPEAPFGKSAADLFADAREHHPALLAARAEVQAAQARVRAIRAEGRPTLVFSAETSERRQDKHIPISGYPPTGAAFRDSALGMQLSIPLFEGFGRGYKVRAASSQAGVKAAELARLEQQVALEVWKNFQSLNTRKEHIEAADTLLVSARRSFEVAEGRFRAGVGNILELLGAQSAVAAAEQRRIEAHAGWLTARLKLAASIGRLGLWAIR